MRSFLLRWQRMLLHELSLLPLLFLLAVRLDAAELGWKLLLPLGLLFHGAVCLLLPGKWRLAAGIALSALLGGGCAFFLPVFRAGGSLVTLIVTCIAAVALIPICAGKRSAEFAPLVPTIGMVAYLVAQFFSDRMEGYDVIGPSLLMCFPVFLLLAMLALCRHGINQSTADGHEAPRAIRSGATLLALGLFAAVLLLSQIPHLAELGGELLRNAVLLILWLISLLTPQLSETAGPSGGGGGLGGLFAEEAEPSMIAVIMEYVMMALAAVVFVILLCWLARRIWKSLKKLLAALMEKLKLFAENASADFEDTEEDTRVRDDSAQKTATAFFARFRREDMSGMTPREKVRFSYRRLLRRHQDWSAGSTAREKLREDAAIYEKARYSNAEISAEEAARFAEQVRKTEYNRIENFAARVYTGKEESRLSNAHLFLSIHPFAKD